MFKKLLIANRGEIALRINRTAQRMGIKTVSVYSDADRFGQFVTACDEAVALGASKASESYLVIEKIIDACKRTGADAVHPGYGFLSENAKFARALEAEGITFVGPSADVIELMGDKIAAIQQANSEAWGKFEAAGTQISRLSEEDAARFRQVAIPLWFEWANKDKDAARLFQAHLDVMQSPSVAYITPDDIKEYSLNL